MSRSIPPDSTLHAALAEHLALVEEIQSVLQEENYLLKQTGQAPDEAFLRRKSLLLPRLDASLGAMRSRPAGGQPLDAPGKSLLRTAQQKLHKLLLLDRENEQLLMRCTLHNGSASKGPVKFGSGQFVKAYGKEPGV